MKALSLQYGFHRNWMHSVLWLNDPDCLIMENARCSIINPGGSNNKDLRSRKMYKFNPIYVRASGGIILSGDNVKTYTKKDIELFQKLISLPKIAAQFDRNFEIGTIKYYKTTKYCIFNTSAFLKNYTITVPYNAVVTYMYSGKILSPKNGQVHLSFRKKQRCLDFCYRKKVNCNF